MLHLGLIMKGIPKIQWLEVIAALLLYATVLIYQGYQYGDGDQSQILPCLYAQDHPSATACAAFISEFYAAWEQAEPGNGYNLKANEWAKPVKE